MRIGTWDDIRRLAQPAWISAQSWHLWCGRLRVAGAGAIPDKRTQDQDIAMAIKLAHAL